MVRRLFFHLKLFVSSLIGKARKVMLGPNTVAVITQTEIGPFATDPQDMVVGRELRKTGSYQREELERLVRYVGGDDNVLVVGAHIGALVIPISRHCKSVVAIEANPDTFRLLEFNLLLNNAKNVRAYNIAASDKAETIDFVSSRSNSGGAKRMPKVRAFEYFYDSPKTISVPAYALDEQLKGEAFSLVLMDIEGSEYFALKGMQDILSRTPTFIVEYLPHHLRNVSGVSPGEFLRLIAPHFEKLFISSKDLQVKKTDFLPALQAMFDQDQGDDGLIFSK
jgi:FkbM family methyltransferase